MFAYFKGILASKKEGSIIVETGGVGYLINYPAGLMDALPGRGEDVTVYTYTSVSQDAVALYGFPTEDDLDLFKRLCYINPFLKLPESNPDSYDNHQSLIGNIQLNQRRPFCDKLESCGILYILLSHFMKYATPKTEVKDSRIHQILAYIRKNIHLRLDIDVLADKACMSKDHFIRVFKREMGETPNVYVTKKKMEKAELLLVTSDLSVKQVADSLGYEDYSYFNKLFKKNAGVTPQQYRMNHS
jgi:AraC-like DNA-binding protein